MPYVARLGQSALCGFVSHVIWLPCPELLLAKIVSLRTYDYLPLNHSNLGWSNSAVQDICLICSGSGLTPGMTYGPLGPSRSDP